MIKSNRVRLFLLFFPLLLVCGCNLNESGASKEERNRFTLFMDSESIYIDNFNIDFVSVSLDKPSLDMKIYYSFKFTNFSDTSLTCNINDANIFFYDNYSVTPATCPSLFTVDRGESYDLKFSAPASHSISYCVLRFTLNKYLFDVYSLPTPDALKPTSSSVI